MRYVIRGSDGNVLVVDAVDWMMAVSQAIRHWGLDVSGWAARPSEGGGMEVVDARSGASWTVAPEGEEVPARALPRAAPPEPDRADPNLRPPEHRTILDETDPVLGPPPGLPERVNARVAEQMRVAEDASDAWRRALDLVTSFVPCEASSALAARGDALEFVDARGKGATVLIGRAVPPNTGIAGAAHALGATLRVDDVSIDHRHFHDLDVETGFHTRAILATPVRHGDRFFGVIELVNPPGRFSTWHVEVAERVAGALGAWLAAQP